MGEKFPVHIMIKPEGLETFPNYVSSQIELLDATYGYGNHRKLITVLTPEEVEMIYPGNSAPNAFKDYLSHNPVEHHFFLGDESIYKLAARMKGKYGQESGIRGTASRSAESLGIKLEKWQNFIHTSGNAEEVHSICRRLTSDLDICAQCSGKSICRPTM